MFRRALASLALLSLVATPAFAQSPPSKAALPDLTKTPTLYAVGYSHLDTEWCWTYPQVIDEFLPNTLHQNFALFAEYPDYIFNWTGANRYRLIKEYYPKDYATLKKYIAAGNWYPNGSALEEGDVDVPSEESIIRQVMYANRFFDQEFGKHGDDFMLPDCFGFPASLPSILAHCGVNGFSTQKLTWGSAVGIPFNVGVWVGPDGRGTVSALNAGDYTASLKGDLSHDPKWIDRVNADGAKSGVFADYMYYGVGDRGGAVRPSDAANLEKSLSGGGPLHIVSARADQMFKDLTPSDIAKLPRYKGDLLLTFHSAGSISSESEMKRWNHENEVLAGDTERASVAADWLGALPYDRARITDAWWRFLPGQFHDLMAGTALPKAYDFAWNDQVIAMNEFAGVLREAVGGASRGLDTRARGVAVVVYNPLSIDRQDMVEATVRFSAAAPQFVQVFGPDGFETPSQVESRSGDTLTVLFAANVPSVGYAVYDVRAASALSANKIASSPLRVTKNNLENARYRVKLNPAGDIASIYDKSVGRELLSAPIRLAFQYENPSQYPAWNMDWEDQSRAPEGYVDGPVIISIAEDGPARVALRVERQARGSRFVQTISLAAGAAGQRVEVANHIEWKSVSCALKAVVPMSASNPLATYNWELGTIQRGNDDPKKYEVPSHEWLDVTDHGGKYGVSFLTPFKYGSDKPSDNTIRLTLLYTPGVRAGYQHQATQDWGTHDIVFALAGHKGDWRTGRSQWRGMALDHPLLAFQAPSHSGAFGKSWSLARVSNPDVSIEALKKAEGSSEVVVRFNELAGKSQAGVTCRFAGRILSAREVNGQEEPLGPATVRNGALVFNMEAYRPRAFAVTLAPASVPLGSPTSVPLKLTYNGVQTGAPLSPLKPGVGIIYTPQPLPQSVQSDGVNFVLAAGAGNNVLFCHGQKIDLPSGHGRRFSILAAAEDGDIAASFRIGKTSETRTIQAWDGYVGRWDYRTWQGEVPKLTYDWHNALAGLYPGYIKHAPIAWYSDHTVMEDGKNKPYAFCYLTRYDFDVPDSATTVMLPKNPNIFLVAATVVKDPNAESPPAQPLYDELHHASTTAPSISLRTAPSGSPVQRTVNIEGPLYGAADAPIRYTLDGSAPNSKSLLYSDFNGAGLGLAQTATVRAAVIRPDGTVGLVTTAQVAIAHPLPPLVSSVNSGADLQSLQVRFTEPMRKDQAESADRYALSPSLPITSSALSDDGAEATLQLGQPLVNGVSYTLAVHGIAAAMSGGLPIPAGTSLPVAIGRPAYVSDAVQAFTGDGNGFSANSTDLPIAGGSPWTINMFIYTNAQPKDLTLFGGFGDAAESQGMERFIGKFADGIHFWASNIDIAGNTPLDIGKWQMLTATFDGTTVKLYKNAQLIASQPETFSDAAPSVKIAPLGPWPTAHAFNGKIAGFSVWREALALDRLDVLLQSEPR